MRTLLKVAVLTVALALLVSIAAWASQSSTAGLPLTPQDIVWDPRTDEGKLLKGRLGSELEALAIALKDSGFTLEENDIAVVKFEESGAKVGLEIRLMSVAVPRSSEGEGLPPVLDDFIARALTPLVQHPKLLEDEDLHCLVFEFRWPGSTGPGAYRYTAQAYTMVTPGPAGMGPTITTRSGYVSVSPGTGSPVWSYMSVEIPRIMVKALADSTITSSELGKYVKEAGLRRRM